MTRYSVPIPLRVAVGRSLLGGRRRSLAADCAALVGGLAARPAVDGLEHIPATGPVALALNHWQRPGLWIGWLGAVVTDAVARVRRADPPVAWLVVDAWRIRRFGGRPRELPATRWAFARVASMWGMTTIPGPDAPVGARARAVRSWLEGTETGDGPALGFFPEGETGTSGPPGEPVRGTDHLLGVLRRRDTALVPVAVWEDGGRLFARFGAPVARDGQGPGTRASELMARIDGLLPSAARQPPARGLPPRGRPA